VSLIGVIGMQHLHAEAKATADDFIATMKAAALAARAAHARAELMRHMLLTAGKLKERPRDAAMRQVVDEWLAAWALDRFFPHVGDMEAVTAAFFDYVRAPSDDADRVLRAAWATIERVFSVSGTPLADRMAWRSSCAHGWWADVCPAPPGEGRADTAWPAGPFWEKGCAPHCL
jgi:hypothetical protein